MLLLLLLWLRWGRVVVVGYAASVRPISRSRNACWSCRHCRLARGWDMFLWRVRVRGKPYCEHDRLGELCEVVPSAAAAAFLRNIHVGKGGLTRKIFLGGRHPVPLLPLVISLSSSCCAVQLSHKCSCWLDITFTREPCCVVVGCGKLRELGQYSVCVRECLESE